VSKRNSHPAPAVTAPTLTPRPKLFAALLVGWLVWLALLWVMWIATKN
jgi:hypothetical protein